MSAAPPTATGMAMAILVFVLKPPPLPPPSLLELSVVLLVVLPFAEDVVGVTSLLLLAVLSYGDTLDGDNAAGGACDVEVP